MRNDTSRTPAAKARTLSRRTERKMKIARGMAALFCIVAFADDATTFAR
jgi:hypothetical protein